jgi:CBS domain-containing protein
MANDDERMVDAFMTQVERDDSNRARLRNAGLAVAIADLDTLRPPVTCPPSTPIRAAVQAMQRERIGYILVMDEDRLTGIFTERDLVNAVADGRVDLDTAPVVQVMTAQPECLGAHYDLVYAINQMSVGGYRHVPVLDDSGKPVHVISARTVLEHLANQFPKEVLNLPPNPQSTVSMSYEGA